MRLLPLLPDVVLHIRAGGMALQQTGLIVQRFRAKSSSC